MNRCRESGVRVVVALLVSAAVGWPVAAQAEDFGVFGVGGLGIGGGDFAGIPDFETGWGVFGDFGATYMEDDFAFLVSVLLTYLRTADGEGDQRVVTVGNFYGATAGLGLGDDGAMGFVRGGLGFGTRGEDATPDGEYKAVTRDRGLAAMAGVGFSLVTPREGLAAEVGLDWVQLFSGQGSGYALGYIGMGFAFGD